MIRVLIIAFFAGVLVSQSAETAELSEQGFQSAHPQGFYGVGHDEHHDKYMGLRNGAGGSCCNGMDGRPTSARFVNGLWVAQVNGVWREINPNVVLTPQVLERQGRERWDAQAHIFTGRSGAPIYCFVPPASGG